MSVSLTPELDDWDEIISTNGNDDNRTVAKVRSTYKLVLAIVNLQNDIASMKKVLGTRIEEATKITKENNDISTKLYKIYIWLTVVIAFSAVASLAISLLAYFKK